MVRTEADLASTPAASDAAATDIGAPPLYFAVLTTAALAGAGHEVLLVQPSLYLSAAATPWLTGITGLGAAAVGVLGVRQRTRDAFLALPWALVAGSLAVGTSGPAAYVAFARGLPSAAVSLAWAVVTGVAVGAVATLTLRALGLTLLRLEAPWRLVHPFRLLSVAVACAVAAGVSSVVGPLRAAIAVAMVLAALGAWTPMLCFFLEQRTVAQRARWVSLGLFAGWLCAFVACEWVVPTTELGHTPNPVVFHHASERGKVTVTSGQEGLELWLDGRLKASTVDERRYFEALVHPIAAVAPHRSRVLLLGGGTGLAEREILRHPEVESVTVVVVDRAVTEVAKTQAWLRRLSADALFSPKVTVIEHEPIVWLGATNERFDVAIVDLPDPETHLEGKNFTRYFYRRLRERLTPDGVCVVQGVSPFAAPTSFDSIVATLRAAELEPVPYHAAVPTLGDWGFVLGFVHAPARVSFEGARPWLSGTTVEELGYVPRDMRAKRPGRPATLHDQSVVEELEREHAH